MEIHSLNIAICFISHLLIFPFIPSSPFIDRDVLNWEDANSEEFSKTTTHPVVVSMLEHNVEQKGGTMRLGERVSVFKDLPEGQTSMMRKMYGNHKGMSRRKCLIVSLWLVAELISRNFRTSSSPLRGQSRSSGDV